MSGEHEENGVEDQNGSLSERPPTNWVDYAEDRYIKIAVSLLAYRLMVLYFSTYLLYISVVFSIF